MSHHENDPKTLLAGTAWQHSQAGSDYADKLLSGTGGTYGLGFRTGHAAPPRPQGFHRSIAYDWDGVISRNPHWAPVYETVDTQLIEDAHERRMAVVVMTCSPVEQVAKYLRSCGFKVFADHKLSVHGDWHGGDDGRRILVTNRKVYGVVAYVDDKALQYDYDVEPVEVWREIERRNGFALCQAGQPHHWGPDGAAGVLPWTVILGRAYVLLSERAAGVQEGGCWSTIGGALDAGETATQGAFREMREEVAGIATVEGATVTAERDVPCQHGCGWSYATLSVHVPNAGALPPVGIAKGHSAWENRSVRWVALDEVASLSLHSGFAAAWPELCEQIEAAV